MNPLALVGADFVTPQLNYLLIGPLMLVLLGGVVSVLVEAFVPRPKRRSVQLVLVFAVLAAALVLVVSASGSRELIASGSVAIDGPGLFLEGTVLILAIIGAMFMAERAVDPAGDAFTARASALPGSDDEREFVKQGVLQTEVWPLFLFSVGGMLLFCISNDLLTMFVALEVLSLPLYLLAGMARRRRLLSQEAAMKYFLLGAFASGFFLYGMALLYGFAGTLTFAGISAAATAKAGSNGLLIAGTILVLVGLLFKVSAVPFHQWAPDVYQGAPTPVTGFMAAATKVAAFGAMLRLMYVALGGTNWDWRPVLWIVAMATMLVGAILAISQNDVKRMLAYSAIAHAGFLLIGVIAASQAGISSTLFYLLTYGITTIGAFACVSLVRDASGEATHLSSWAGLGKKSPWLAGAFAIFLLAFAGIPLTSGFTGKFAVFSAGIDGGATPVVIVAVIASAIAAFFYARVIVLMFFSEPPEDGPRVVVPSAFTAGVIAIGVAVTVLLGVIPQPVLELAQQAGNFVR